MAPMDYSEFENATHSALYNTEPFKFRLLVFKEEGQWSYQMYNMNTGESKNFPVADWVSGRTFAKQALEKIVCASVDLDWAVTRKP